MIKIYRYKTNKKHNATMGIMLDGKGGVYETLENAAKKLAGGTYKVTMTWSPKFNAIRPLITNEFTPESRGIRIHEGNKSSDSQGCILIGNGVDLSNCTISSSQAALNQLMKALDKENTLEIIEE